ncbi:uncharacterized protein BKCO1_4600038 [Diplodia corticola]|uniref:Uncharacterized protein n=1 Tax=Diplodia corticola TaxID=236234 RepID=A0A1J9RUN5_9PEZI|nr:uncharacterized protein BKCO1_4600038 [Diplodia corticola]OJD31564.1 hypothetical protein BKCO1_4600038 [Diplodia corticola]
MADDPPEASSSAAARPFPVQPKQPPALRHRLPRSHTTPWDASASSSSIAPPPHVLRRRSSIISDFSSIRDSTDNILNPGSRDADKLDRAEPTHWHSLPLVFAILPAVSGIFFQNGSAVVTDILLLGLASLLLNWCVRMPWEWYHAAHTPASLVQAAGIGLSDTIPEEDSEDDQVLEDSLTADAKTVSEHSDNAQQDTPAPERSPEYVAAVRELQFDQLYALAACFLGPVFGAYLLHAIRASLSRPSEGLVSNYNLTIFLLAAEVRPASHLLRMLRARTMYLQRVVREQAEPDLKPDESVVSDLGRRLSELESHMADVASANAAIKQKEKSAGPTNSAEVVNSVRQTFQPQLDALNRAVRRYEKRATTQTMTTEARLQDLESRLKDALALAAAAARGGQQKKPGVVTILYDWLRTLLMIPLQAMWTLMVYPFQMLSSMTISVKKFLFGYTKKVDKKGKGKAKSVPERGHGSLNGYRAQAGPSGRR